MNNENWITVCRQSDLVTDSGVCVLLNGEQIALFQLSRPDGALYALHNYDPVGDAWVISRGIVGSVDGEPVVASPLYKEHYSLASGQCLERPELALPVYPVRYRDDSVQLAMVEQ